MRLRIKNWKTFQHYDHRCPPWIKLHFKILSSRDWVSASDSERVLAIACMLIASQDEAKDGSFDADPEYLQRVAYLHEYPDFTNLIRRGFLEPLADASKSKQMLEKGCTEKETETEKSREDGSTLVFQIATSYPKASHYRNELELPPSLVDAIIQAIDADGPEAVLQGTREFAEHLDNPTYAPDPYKFFKEFQYRRKHVAKSASKFDQFFESMETPDEQLDAERPGNSTGKVQRISDALR